MSEYLSKEEIRRWRSSLERITLEEYAARLGKIIQEEKHDDSLVDSVMLRSLNSMTTDSYVPKAEKIQSLSIKSFNKEKEIKTKKADLKQAENDVTSVKEELKKVEKTKVVDIKKQLDNVEEKENQVEKQQKPVQEKPVIQSIKQEIKEEIEKEPVVAEEENINFSFSKALTAREQLVFDHFLANKNTIVYAKDLAEILDLPRDYVYKYIKNLRGKLNENILQNADIGGYMLKVQ